MQRLYRKRIVLGVGGGIAAYKSAELVRRLRDQGAEVRVVMTRGGREFITPLTLQALSGHPVHLDLLDPEAEAAMGHIELARWADLVLIAPATADLIARLAQGVADDLLSTLVLATDAPVALAPAMNQAMWRDPATQANTQLLEQRGIRLFGPAAGSQACGDVGPGRMLEAEELAQRAADILGGEVEFWDIGDYPMRVSDETLFRLVDLYRTLQPAFVLSHSVKDPYNFDHPLAMHVAQEARVIAQAEGHNPGQKILGAPPVYAFEPHQPEQCGWEPNTFLDITEVWDTKRRAIECMAGQEHLWHYYTRVAQQRGVQAKRNIGITAARNIEYAEGFMRLTPSVVEAL